MSDTVYKIAVGFISYIVFFAVSWFLIRSAIVSALKRHDKIKCNHEHSHTCQSCEEKELP